MATVEYVPVEEMLPARALRKESQRRQVRSEYEVYVGQLVPGHAGKLTIDKGEKFSTLRDRLRSAARRLDKKLQIRRKGDILYFRLRDADPDDAQDDAAAPTPRTATDGASEQTATAPARRRRPAAAKRSTG